MLGGGGVTGTVSGSGAAATYRTPAAKPSPNTVAVSARVHNPKKGATAKTLVDSNITIEEDSWTGTGTSTSAAIDGAAQVTWVLERADNNVTTYRPTGSASIVVHGCITYEPSSGAINPTTGGVLFIDYNTNPPTYHGTGLTHWPALAVVTCPNPPPPFSTFATAVFFGGSKGTLGTEAQGLVSPDGVTTEGTDTKIRWDRSR